MDSELARVYEAVTQAVCPEDVFGVLTGPDEGEALAAVFRQMARGCHPDRFNGDPEARELAQEAFQKLNDMRERAERKLARKTYGEREAPSDDAPASGFTEIETAKHRYRISTTPLAEGDLCYVFRGTVAGGEGDPARIVVKVAKEPADNDLVRNEIRVLTRLWLDLGSGGKHLPVLLDQFKTEGKQALVLREIDAHDIPTILEKYPAGIDPAHVGWILHRLLSVLGFAHSKGIVHCNVEPAHVMVRPRDHNVFLIDWSYAAVEPARTGEGFRTVNELYSPPEAAERKPPVPASDLYSAAKCMVELLGGNPETGTVPPSVPDRLKRYLDFMLITAPRMRAQDAWEMHRELSQLRQDVFGHRGFIELPM